MAEKTGDIKKHAAEMGKAIGQLHHSLAIVELRIMRIIAAAEAIEVAAAKEQPDER